MTEDNGLRRRASDTETEQQRLDRLERIEYATRALRETVAGLSAALNHTTAAMFQIQHRADSAATRVEEVAVVAADAPTKGDLRRRFAFGALVVALFVYVSALAYDVYAERCVIHGPRTRATKRVCDDVMFLRDHDYAESAEGIVAERLRASRVACLQSNRRVEVEAEIFDNLALTIPPEAPSSVAAALRASASELRALRSDCDRLFPVADLPTVQRGAL